MSAMGPKFLKLISLLYGALPYPSASKKELENVKIVAHRGDWNNKDRSENTLDAFNSCLNKKIWAIEFDIRWTQDNKAIVHHDPNTRRVFKKDLQIKNTNWDLIHQEFTKMGIPEKDLEHILQPFYRSDQSRNQQTGGYGLGLAITHKIVQQHHGQLKIRNIQPTGLELQLNFTASDS
mgnify:CR=1 FL=1